MRPTLSRPAAKIVFFLFLFHFWTTSDNSSPFWLLVLDRCVPPERAMIKRQKSVTASSAQRNWLKRATE
jgi:hypothetical protein